MRTRFKKLSLAVMLAISLPSFAHDFEVDGMYYNILSSIDKTVEVTRRGIKNAGYYKNDYTGSVTIPTTVAYSGTTYSVTSIGGMTFEGCTGLKSVTIPNSVTSIGNYAFEGCSGKVTIPNSVISIGGAAFYNCSGLTSVTIPNSVTSIGGHAFHGTSWYNNQSDGILYLDNCCLGFKGDEPTGEISLKEGTRLIGGSAFRSCIGLTEVTIPNSVTSIGSEAFKDCTGLTSVTIPNTVSSIGYATFKGCSGLTSVTIPNSVTSIGNSAFDGTGWYNNQSNGILYLDNCCLGYKGDEPTGKISLKEGTRLIGGSAFEGCSGLTSVTIPNSVTSIGDYAFYNCSGLTSVTIPNSVTSIGGHAFHGCSGLTEVNITDLIAWCKIDFEGDDSNPLLYVKHLKLNGTEITDLIIPDGITAIKSYAFSGCSGLTSVTIPNSVSSIGGSAFSVCKNLRSVTIGNSVTSIGASAFSDCSGLTEVIIPNSVTSIGKYAFYNCSGLTSVTIPNSVTTIGQYAFYNCSGLTEVTIGNSVTSIKDVFGGCKKITKLVIADGSETLSLGNSFTDCPFVKLYLGRDYCYNTTNSPFINKKTLKEITIGNSITSIREKEFLNCIGLTSLTIGTGVLSIGTNAFSYYDNNNYSNLDIKKVIWLTNTPPQGYETVAGEVNYVANNRYSDLSNVTIYPYLSSLFEVDGIKYVPVSPSERTCDALDCSYETTISNINIGKTVSFKGIEMNIKAVKPYTFYDNTNITKATIDSEFNGSIGDYAFAYCNKIDEIILPDGVTSLGGSAFEGCSSLASVDIGSGIPALNDNAFYGCTPLSEITIPANVTSIGNNVFGKCSSLEELTITDRDTELSLGSNGSNPLFSDCPLKSVYIGGNISYPTSSDYGYSPFYRNTSLETVVITDKETEISENEFYGCTALKTVSMGDGVKTIGDWAFSGCSSLDSFSFGTGMKTIGTEAFSDCTAMTKLYSKAIVPPTCGTQALDDINKWNCELYVPQASITKYQIVDQWKEFFFIKDIESGIEDVYVEEVAVTVEGGEIVVKNVTGIVTVYNLNGIAVATETADGNEVRFDNLQPGVYIVVVNNKSVKVVL